MDLGLTGKVAIVAGTNKGLGFAVTKQLAAEGAKVMNKICLTIATLMVGLATSLSAQDESASQKDILGKALSFVGFTREDLGYQPKGYWTRYPNPRLIPHKLPFFDDLFSEPLRTYDFTKTMANVVEDYLNPEYLSTHDNALHQIVYFLGVDRKIGGFRNYSVNLAQEVDKNQPLLEAIKKVFTATGDNMKYTSFGQTAEWPNPEVSLSKQIENIDSQVQKILASLILNVLDAYRWRQIGVRNLPVDKMQRVFFIRDLGETQGDGQRYYPEIDDIATLLDEQSLYYSSMKAAQAAEEAAKELDSLFMDKAIDFEKIHFNFLTPIGRIVFSGSGDDNYIYQDCAVFVDFGGDDVYEGPIGATPRTDIPISVAIDLAGNDTYNNETADFPAQGAGILGTGILIDVRGNDIYKAKTLAQGLGFFGLGTLLDKEGDDSYFLETSGQGAGFFGIGLALDVTGNDKYYIYGEGQGFGGVGGVGVLANWAGTDQYQAEPYTEKVNRGDYHSEHKINVNNVQGVGSGRRGDGSDGHSWAGGLGAIIDIEGDDTYLSGNWSLGTGYWYGTGLVYDGAGNDEYRSCYFTQASGAHYCIGALIDEGGNDKHILYETAGAGLAFGWDYTNALLVDKGGNDTYEAKIISLGLAQIRSNAFLFDIGGDDQYKLGKDQQGMGAATFLERYKKPNRYSPYYTYSKSIGLLIDIGGQDSYQQWDTKTGKSTSNEKWGNNTIWFSPAKGSENYGYNNFGIGVDVEEGRIPELYIYEEEAAELK